MRGIIWPYFCVVCPYSFLIQNKGTSTSTGHMIKISLYEKRSRKDSPKDTALFFVSVLCRLIFTDVSNHALNGHLYCARFESFVKTTSREIKDLSVSSPALKDILHVIVQQDFRWTTLLRCCGNFAHRRDPRPRPCTDSLRSVNH